MFELFNASHLPKQKWIRELLAYSGQTYFLSVINIIASILLVRFLSRDGYGLYGLVFAISGVITNVFGLGVFPLATTLGLKAQSPEEEKSVRGYLSLGISYALALSILTLGGLAFFYGAHVVLYISAATFGWFFYNLLPFTYISSVRKRHIKGFIWIEVTTQLVKTILPILWLGLYARTISSFFVGYTLSIVLILSVYVFRIYKDRVEYVFLPKKLTFRITTYANLLVRGVGIAFESGAATFYGSLLLIFASRMSGLALTADVKVLIGFISTLSFVSLPVYKWIGNHLPKKLAESKDPWRDMMIWNGVGVILGVVIYGVGWILGPRVFVLVYGAAYAHIWPEYGKAGLWLVFTGGAAGMSVFSRLQGLSWKFGILSLLNVLAGIGFVIMFHLHTLSQLALFYGLWVLPALLGCYLLSYHYRYVHKKIRNV